MPITKEMLEKRAAQVRTGGKGTMRRTTKAPHKSAGTDDKKVQTTLKKLGVTPIGDIEEVQMLRGDGSSLVFKNPKVQASMQSHCYVVSGNYTTENGTDEVAE
jgi:nascent polypeptide-associated complex subunit beta